MARYVKIVDANEVTIKFYQEIHDTEGKLVSVHVDYLNRQISLTELVDWAENVIMEGEFDEQDADLLTDIVARLGLADVREFGLSWDDCHEFLARLGYRVEVTAVLA